MPPTDPTPEFDERDALLARIERRATQIWFRRRLGLASAALAVAATVAVPVAVLSSDDSEVVEAAGPAGPAGTAEPDGPVTPEPLPPSPPPTTTTSLPPPSGCVVTEEARALEGRDGYLEVTVTAGSERTCVGHENVALLAIHSTRSEVTVVEVDWGDGTVDADPEPAMVCEGPTDTAIKTERPSRHAYAAPGVHVVSVTVRSIFCTSDGVDEYRVVLDIPFTVA